MPRLSAGGMEVVSAGGTDAGAHISGGTQDVFWDGKRRHNIHRLAGGRGGPHGDQHDYQRRHATWRNKPAMERGTTIGKLLALSSAKSLMERAHIWD